MSGYPLAVATAALSASLLAVFLARGRLRARLFADALAIGLTLGACVAAALAPFDLSANPLHYAPQTLAFLFAGLPEEGVKMLGVAAFLRAHYLVRDRRDVVFAAGALSLAFATLETGFYLAGAGANWATLAFERALTAVPFHVFLGLAGGYVIARMRPGWRGLTGALAAWLGLAAIHGVYDLAVFAGAPAAAPPEALRRLEAALGGSADTTLRGLLCAAEAVAAVLGVAAVAAAPPRSEPARGRLPRLLASRGFGWLVGGALAGGAALALADAALMGVMLASPDVFLRDALLAILPLALGAAFLAAPATSAPASLRARRAAAVAVASVGLAAVAAALVWAPPAWRDLSALREQTRGARLAAAGDYARAIDAYGRALAIAPKRVAALALRAAAYAELDRDNAALADLDAALKIAPQAIPLYLQRADVDRRRNDPAASAADLDAALRLAPGDPQLLALRGQARLEAGDEKGAQDDLLEAEQRAPGNALVQRTVAAWRVHAGDLDGALRELNAALHDNPADGVAAFQRGRIWLYRGEYARARADFLRADDKPAFLYPALWSYLADARLLQEGATDLRRRLAAAPGPWPAPVARMLLGELTPEAARAAAKDDDQRCEADFYTAMLRLGIDSTDASAARFEAALKQCPTGFIEYEGARAELHRLGR